MRLNYISTVKITYEFEDYRRFIKIAYLIENPLEFMNAIKSANKFGDYYIRIDNGKFHSLTYIRHKHRHVDIKDRIDQFELPDVYKMYKKLDFKFIGLLSSLLAFFYIPIQNNISLYLALGILIVLTIFSLRYIVKPEGNYIRMMTIINKIIENHERLDSIERGLRPLLENSPKMKRKLAIRRSMNRSLHGKRTIIYGILKDLHDRTGEFS